MRVALFSDTFRPQINGVTNTLDKMINYFEENGIEYRIFAPMYDDDVEDNNTERFYSLKFFLYPECRLAIPNVFRISESLAEFKPDLIHLMTEFNMGIAGLRYGKKNNIPTVSSYTTNFAQYTEYYNIEFLKQPIGDYMRWFHNQNSITLCPSYAARNHLNENGIYHTDIFSRGIDTNRFNPAHRDLNLRKKLGIENKTVFLYVGRISFEKDLDVLSESYKAVKKKYGDRVTLMITGDGPYLQKCKELFGEDTIFTGFKKGKELAKIYASSDIFVCPSSTETFGNVILEAMSSGLSVIGANAGGVGEIIKHMNTGLKFKEKDEKELTKCMTRLVEDMDLRNHLKENAIEYSKSKSWDSIIGGLVENYRKIIQKQNANIA